MSSKKLERMDALKEAKAALEKATEDMPSTRKDLKKLYDKIEKLIPKIEDIEHGELLETEFISSKKKNYVYLAGNISADIKTYTWREEFVKCVKDEYRIVVVNPCLNEFDKTAGGSNISQMQLLKKTSSETQKILRAKDYKMISICNIFVVNLELYNRERPMIGTLQELVWAHDVFYMPVLAITGKNYENNPYVNHPWIEECISAKVKTVKEAAEMIKNFFVEY